MSLLPRTNNSAGNEIYFALKTEIPTAQTLSQAGNVISLSGGGGSVNVSTTTSVALSTQKLTAVTYDTGLLETNVAGVLNVGLGSAIGSTRVEGAKIVIQRDLADPQIEFVKGLGVERIKYDGTKLLMGSVGISGEIYDNFGSPGAAGQQLQSSGPGLPFVWGAGSGVGLTAVVAGSNIGVDNTNPIAPVVSVAISSNLDMSGQNIINGNDVTLKGANPSINFQNIAGTDRAFLDYVDSSDKVTLSGLNVVAEAVGAGRGHRMILDAAGAALTSQDADVTLQRSQTGLGIRTIATLEDNGIINVGANGITTFPTIKLISGTDPIEFMTMTYDSSIDKGTIKTETNGQLLFQGGSSFTMDSGGTMLFTASDPITLQAKSGDSIMLMDADITMTTTPIAGLCSYTLSDKLTYNNKDIQLVDPTIPAQVPTNAIAVPIYLAQDAGSLSTNLIDNAPTNFFFETSQFAWRYSGNNGAESEYCVSDIVEIDMNIVGVDGIPGGAEVTWGVLIRDPTNPTAPYYATYPFHSFDTIENPNGREYSSSSRKALSGPQTINATFKSIFQGVGAIVDGTFVRIEVWAGTPGTPFSIGKTNYSCRIRPVKYIAP